jgi:uracil phosphoribosyltransferase
MDDLSGILVYEASRDIEVESVDIDTPMGVTTGTRVSRPPLVVPVLRAGLGMLGGVLRHLPETDTGFIGVARNEETFVPEPYMNSVPDELHGRPVLVLDPMLATGGSLDHTCRILADHGAGPLTCVCVLAAPEGVARLEASRLVSHVVTASIDERLNDHAYIIPGLGDAGDRLFGTA